MPRLAALGALAAAVASAAWVVLEPADSGLPLLLAAVGLLVAGAAWLETGPDAAKEIVLVATLAAVAAAGRVLFVAIPGVQPVTVITVAAGAALGPRAGFATGALAALSSNFFLGQGPWTPWQMLGWGACGLAGSALAPLIHRRVSFAAVCFVLGFAFSALMDLWLWVTFWPHTWQALTVVFGQGLSFQAAHAIGNVVIALAIGPELLRLLERYSRRLRTEVVWAMKLAVAAIALGARRVAGRLRSVSPAVRRRLRGARAELRPEPHRLGRARPLRRGTRARTLANGVPGRQPHPHGERPRTPHPRSRLARTGYRRAHRPARGNARTARKNRDARQLHDLGRHRPPCDRASRGDERSLPAPGPAQERRLVLASARCARLERHRRRGPGAAGGRSSSSLASDPQRSELPQEPAATRRRRCARPGARSRCAIDGVGDPGLRRSRQAAAAESVSLPRATAPGRRQLPLLQAVRRDPGVGHVASPARPGPKVVPIGGFGGALLVAGVRCSFRDRGRREPR